MVQIILLILFVALIVIGWAIIAGIGIFLFYLMLAISVVTVIVVHGQVYFKEKHAGVSKAIIYVPVLLAMLITVCAMVPGLRSNLDGISFHLVRWHAYLLIPAVVYYTFGLRRIGPKLIHPYYAGAVYPHQIRSAIRTLPGIWAGVVLAAPWVSVHWIGIIAGLVALVFGIPLALGVLVVSTLSGLTVAILWGSLIAVPMLLLMLVFKLTRKSGNLVHCSDCGLDHVLPGPGPWGLFSVECECGHRFDLWEAGADEAAERTTIGKWYERERNLGAMSLLSLSLASAVTLLSVGEVTWVPHRTQSTPVQEPSPKPSEPAPVASSKEGAKASSQVRTKKERQLEASTTTVSSPRKEEDAFSVRESGPPGEARKPAQKPTTDPFVAKD